MTRRALALTLLLAGIACGKGDGTSGDGTPTAPRITTGTISGTITNATNGTPVAGATVTTQPATSSTVTNAEGAYTIGNVSAGTYTVNVSASGYNAGSTSATVTAGQTASASVALAPLPGTITGTVTSAAGGAPLANAAVSTNPATSSVTTNAQGVYTITSAPSRTYSVVVTLDGFTSATVTATVPPGGTVTANVSLAPMPGTITGTVTSSAGGAPLAGVTVSTTPSTSSTTTNSLGVYTISGVAPGTYTVNAALSGYNGSTAPATVAPGQTTTTNLTLAPLPGSIVGTITHAVTGVPLANVTITTTPATSTVTTNAQGAFVIGNVAPRSYTLNAALSGFLSNASGQITVGPGQTVTANLTLAPLPNYNGSWTGATSQGRNLTFTVANNAFTNMNVGFSVTGAGCTLSGSVGLFFTVPRAITSDNFTITSTGGPPVSVSMTVRGTFTGEKVANGNVSITVAQLPPLPPCSGSANFTWTATRP